MCFTFVYSYHLYTAHRDPSRPCPYCGEFKTRLTIHLTKRHSDQARVKLAMKASGRTRYAIFADLKRDGIKLYNIKVLKECTDMNKLLRERNQGRADLVYCNSCSAFLSRRFYKVHRSKCTGEKSIREALGVESLNVDKTGSEKFQKEILSKFRQDEAGQLCRNDPTIRLVGERLFTKLKKKPDKKVEVRKTVMSDMRKIANLYVNFKQNKPPKCSVPPTAGDMLHRANFHCLELAIRDYTGYEDVNELKAGLKSTLYYLLKSMASIVKSSYLVELKDSEAAEVEKFVEILELNSNIIFGDATYKINRTRQTRLRRPEALPLDADIAVLRNYTIKKMNEILQEPSISSANFTLLRDLLVSRLTMFNFRRGGEPARLHITDWLDAKRGVWVNQDNVMKMRLEDRKLFSNMKVIYQTGKGNNHLVPVLVPVDTVKGLDVLCDSAVRSSVGVLEGNEYLFPGLKLSAEHCSGWHSIKHICVLSGVKNDSTITATKLRHYSSTRYATLEIPEADRPYFFKHMGHSQMVNETIYQAPPAEAEVTVVGRVLQDFDKGTSIGK